MNAPVLTVRIRSAAEISPADRQRMELARQRLARIVGRMILEEIAEDRDQKHNRKEDA